MKRILALMVLFVVSLLAVTTVVSAAGTLPVKIEELKIDDKIVGVNENLYVQEGDTLTIDIKLENTGNDTAEDIEVEAALKGYEYSSYESVSDSSSVFDLDGGDTRWVTLKITLPTKLDKDLYLLRIRVTDKNSQAVTQDYSLKVNPSRHGLDIKDVVFSPGTTVTAGHSLLTTVLIDNYGGKDEDDVKVTLEIPDLKLTASDYISQIDSEDKKTSEELFLKIPTCTEAGTYTATVTLTYDEGYRTVSKDYTLTVADSSTCSLSSTPKLTVTLSQDSQDVAPGQQATYPIVLTNGASTSATYLLDLSTGSWATSKLSENAVVLGSGETKVVYAYVTADEKATAGSQTATLTVEDSNGNTLKTASLKANVVGGSCNLSLRTGLEIALIVLVALLVIIGLVLGFSRLKKDDNNDKEEEEVIEEDGEDKTYY